MNLIVYGDLTHWRRQVGAGWVVVIKSGHSPEGSIGWCVGGSQASCFPNLLSNPHILVWQKRGSVLRALSRGPMLWTADSNTAGFTSATSPWFPVHPSYRSTNVEVCLCCSTYLHCVVVSAHWFHTFWLLLRLHQMHPSICRLYAPTKLTEWIEVLFTRGAPILGR